jgi:hypothetical protein
LVGGGDVVRDGMESFGFWRWVGFDGEKPLVWMWSVRAWFAIFAGEGCSCFGVIFGLSTADEAASLKRMAY